VETEEMRALLALNALPGLGPGRLGKALAELGSAVAVLARWPKLPVDLPQALRAVPVAKILAFGAQQDLGLQKLAAQSIGLSCNDYPSALKHLAQLGKGYPPPILNYLGSLEGCLGGQLCVAVVGSRACTPYGRDQAFRMGAGLAAAGVTVVSGAARGIDQAAMRGALSVQGKVVAVLGSGLDRPYPPDARSMLEQIVQSKGCVFSEFALGTTPHRGNFPRRNRIIAALARGTVVIEAGPKSGSMNTVQWSLDLGREVFAMPGPVHAICSRGPHQLLREGAHFTEGPTDVLAEFQITEPLLPFGPEPGLLRALAKADLGLDQLAHETGREPDELLAELAEFELEGKVLRRPGGLYHRCGPKPV
jgi:DNA processing protein